MDKTDVRRSKRLSQVLRHQPGSVGIELDPHGWVDLPTLLDALAAHGSPMTRDDVDRVVRSNDKQRFEIDATLNRIRARQGHTVEVDLGLVPAQPPAVLTGGNGDYLAVLTGLLEEHGATTTAEEIYAAMWNSIVTNQETVEVVRGVRAAGYGAHLGTNQARHRGAFMRTGLGYDDLFDVSCYSYDFGVAKPDPRFFLRCAERVGADPHEILFIDDSAGNVAAARSVGMTALHWYFDPDVEAEHTGHVALVGQLAAHGAHL